LAIWVAVDGACWGVGFATGDEMSRGPMNRESTSGSGSTGAVPSVQFEFNTSKQSVLAILLDDGTSTKNRFHHMTVDIGQSMVASTMPESQFLVIDSELVQYGCPKVINLTTIFDGMITEFVGRTINRVIRFVMTHRLAFLPGSVIATY